jgi:hypothetical protein
VAWSLRQVVKVRQKTTNEELALKIIRNLEAYTNQSRMEITVR